MSHPCQQLETKTQAPCCPRKGHDYFMWICASLVATLYISHFLLSGFLTTGWIGAMTHSVYKLLNNMWWGVLLGILMLSILSVIPREFVTGALGTRTGFKGIVRATLAGVLLDLCSHGILMVGAKLYERGVSIGQVMAFLIASPWNSFSLTLILFSLIGVELTLTYIALSMAIGVITGMLFEWSLQKKLLPPNPSSIPAVNGFKLFPEARRRLKNVHWTYDLLFFMLKNGIHDARMVVRWLLFGVLLASLINGLINAETLGKFFGPSLLGLGLTMVAATVIEVCSEGSTPVAADLVTRGGAPGNGFAFLMTGVSTDYTEIMVLKDTTRSWKIPLFLPLFTLPQVMVIAWLLNHGA